MQAVTLGFAQCLSELGRARRQQHHGLLHIPPRGSGGDSESGSELGERFSLAQVDLHEQGLAVLG